MPIYPMICPKCAHSWEITKSMSDPLPKSCPECRGRKVGIDYTGLRIAGVVKGKDRNEVEANVRAQLRQDMERMRTDPEFIRNVVGTTANPLLRDNRGGMEAGVTTIDDVDKAAIKVSGRKKKKKTKEKKKGTK